MAMSSESDNGSNQSAPEEGGPTSENGRRFRERTVLVKELGDIKAGTRFQNKYEIKAQSVAGKFQIRFAEDLEHEQRQVVLKFYSSAELYDNSIDIHSKLSTARCVCPLLETLETLETETEYTPCNVYPLGQHTVSNWLRVIRPSMIDRRWCLHQILTAVQEIHSLNIVHCDLKPTNIMFFDDDTRWKLVDFDSARTDGSEMHGAFTVAYAPPEVVLIDRKDPNATKPLIRKSIDMWACGVLVYEILTGERMHEVGADLEEVKRALREGDVYEKIEKIDERAHKKLMVNLLKENPEERWTAERALLNGTFRSNRGPRKKTTEQESQQTTPNAV